MSDGARLSLPSTVGPMSPTTQDRVVAPFSLFILEHAASRIPTSHTPNFNERWKRTRSSPSFNCTMLTGGATWCFIHESCGSQCSSASGFAMQDRREVHKALVRSRPPVGRPFVPLPPRFALDRPTAPDSHVLRPPQSTTALASWLFAWAYLTPGSPIGALRPALRILSALFTPSEGSM